MKLRQYISSDCDQVWALHNSALSAADAHAGNGPWDDDLKDVPGEYLRPGGEFLVGVEGNRIIAMGAFKRLSDTEVEIKRMRVSPKFQRRGYGKYLLLELEERARSMGYKKSTLDTTTKQIAARRLYTCHGYVEVRRERSDKFELIFFEKQLAS